MQNNFNNRYFAVISGAWGHIGKKISQKFIDKGFSVLLMDKVKPQVKNPQYFIKTGDMTENSFIKECVKEMDFNKKIININCVGITKDALCIRQSEEDFTDILNVNLKSIFLLTGEILKNSQKGAHIINLSSISGLQGRQGQSAYSASKGALIAYTKSLAREGAQNNIRANIVLPGFINSSITAKLTKKAIDKIKQTHLLKRLQNADELANFIYNLSIMENVSGQIFNLDSRINT